MDPTKELDNLIAGFTDWCGPALATIRRLFHGADPDVVEDWNYTGSPCWYNNGLPALGNAVMTKVKPDSFDGTFLVDQIGPFNAGLEGDERRAVEPHECDKC